MGDVLGDPGPVPFLAGIMFLASLVLGLAACASRRAPFAPRAIDRNREPAIRLAVGSTRVMFVGKLLAESPLVSILAQHSPQSLKTAIEAWSKIRILSSQSRKPQLSLLRVAAGRIRERSRKRPSQILLEVSARGQSDFRKNALHPTTS